MNTTLPRINESHRDIPPGSISISQFTELTAVERSKALLFVKTEPYLQFMCGPLLKYDTIDEHGVWHGAVMIVTVDSVSVYDPPPTLSYSWDPASDPIPSPNQSVPPNRRRASTAASTTSNTSRSSVAFYELGPHPSDPHSIILPTSSSSSSSSSSTFSSSPQFNLATGSTSRRASMTPQPMTTNERIGSRRASSLRFGPGAETQREYRTKRVLGQELWVYGEESGTFTFWRFLITIPLTQHEMAVRYSVNNGQLIEFWVPGKMQNMRWAAYSVRIHCNGFSADVDPDDFRGPGFKSGYDPVWVDLLTKHHEQPFHALVGGGNQLYCDDLMHEFEMRQWASFKSDPKKKLHFLMSPEMKLCIDRFFFNRYCQAFRRGAFARANCSIPMLNMCNDHDIIESFGSYPDNLQKEPVFRQIGARGYFFFLLFQCFINVEVNGVQDFPGEHVYRSLIIGEPGPYMRYSSHSFLTRLGPQVYMLLLDCRAERMEDQVCSVGEYQRVFERLNGLPPGVEHVIIQLGMPIAYPNMSSKKFLEKIKKNDHWNARSHKLERDWLIKQLQEFAYQNLIRVSFLSGDVSCAAVGVFKTYARSNVSHRVDHRYMVNVVTSAIVNTPPSDDIITEVASLATADHSNLHRFKTDKAMVDLFSTDPDGQSRRRQVAVGTPKFISLTVEPHQSSTMSKSSQMFIMGKRNYCMVNWEEQTGDLVFDIRVEKEKGYGETVGYGLVVPRPGWR